MALVKIPSNVKSLISASNKINNYMKAIEELVYNALDADATSIAIRINVQENAIQVVDNGCGVCNKDFECIGQKYMTSKFVDLYTLKSEPNKYGFRGQALANIINVSKSVRVIARHEKSEETWMKLFEYGKEKQIKLWTKRPSKGTTVEINGLLYNLNIQRKSKDILYDIKTFLEHLSLVHINISMSLRDDSKNEINFKMHKNRDMYQTLSLLYNIQKEEVKELKVEKNKYNVTAFLGKTDKEIGKHCIFLNGKFISNSNKLYKIVKNIFSKDYKYEDTNKAKAQNSNKDEECHLFQMKIPFYFIFMKCPYMDYELSNSPKQSVLEFKHWNQVKTLLEKLVKFFNGDMNLKEVDRVEVDKTNHETENSFTKKQVKKIMEKILGTQCKNPELFHLHKGIKGNQVKRKFKHTLAKSSLAMTNQRKKHYDSLNIDINGEAIDKEITKVADSKKVRRIHKPKINQQLQTSLYMGKEDGTSKIKITKNYTKEGVTKSNLGSRIGKAYHSNVQKVCNNKEIINNTIEKKHSKSFNIDVNDKEIVKEITEGTNLNKVHRILKRTINQQLQTSLHLRKENIASKMKTKNYSKECVTKSNLGSHIGKAYNSNFQKVCNEKEIINNTTEMKLINNKNSHLKCNNILKKFELETRSVKRRCNELDKATKDMLLERNKRKRKIYVNENVQHTNVTKNNVNYSVRQQIEEIIIHDYFPRALENNAGHKNIFCNDVKRSDFQSNYDLIQTILKSQGSFERQILDESKHPVTLLNKLQPTTTVRNHCLVDTATYCNSIQSLRSFQTHNSFEPILTYDSHNYNANIDNMQHLDKNRFHTDQMEDINCRILNKIPRTFITKQSKDNFQISKTSINTTSMFKRKNNNRYTKSTLRKLFHKTSKLFALKNQIIGNTGESSHTIEFTESSFKVNDNDNSNLITNYLEIPGLDIECSRPQSTHEDYNVCNKDDTGRISLNTNTYTVTRCIDNNGYTVNDSDSDIYNTYTINNADKIIDENKEPIVYSENFGFEVNQSNNKNFIFLSISQGHEQNDQLLDPRNVCETILDSQNVLHKEFEFSFKNRQYNLPNNVETNSFTHNHADDQNTLNDSISKSFKVYENVSIKDVARDHKPNQDENVHPQDILKEISHHFSIPQSNYNRSPIINSNTPRLQKQEIKKVTAYETSIINQKDSSIGDFHFKNRPKFLPKGMSPIFQNCYTRNVCAYNLSEDYYEDEMYNNFADNVRNNAEIFEPNIQEAKEVTNKGIDKVSVKIKKDNATLKFDGQSLKEAKVLGQIDEKFIAAIVKGNTEEVSHFLVLFDQHAVHERIRLENNLSEYLIGNQWTPINIDEVTLKMSNDHILYLHNYKEKFAQLGLKWTVLNNEEVSFTALPEAILGKNPRQVDRVIKAVKSLITEEINIIKIQGGCISLFPKSIMELVFSEACRYAIKFGDKLSKSECAELLKKLSSCKTPFQCAHGRPVMAVIMDIKLNTIDYKININEVMKWKGRQSS